MKRDYLSDDDYRRGDEDRYEQPLVNPYRVRPSKGRMGYGCEDDPARLLPCGKTEEALQELTVITRHEAPSRPGSHGRSIGPRKLTLSGEAAIAFRKLLDEQEQPGWRPKINLNELPSLNG